MTTSNPDRLLQTRCFLLDMDGTVYLGGQLLPGAVDFIRLLEERGTAYLFLTNNSSRDRQEYAAKLRRLGIDVSEDKIFTSGEATAIYLSKRQPGARVYVVGTPTLEQELSDHGFTLTDQSPDFVVLGFDTTMTYEKIWKLCDLVTAKVPLIATHPDINCPTETGFMPDIGAMLTMIATSTGRHPEVIVGKPNRPIVDALAEKLNLPVEQLCMVGDRLYTDIALGKTGLTTVLVLSGETHQEDLETSPFQPDYIMENLAELRQTILRASTQD